ncbi:MAG: hypothetical protein ACREXR_22895, partial [Gammaproteobacteria bacterium]
MGGAMGSFEFHPVAIDYHALNAVALARAAKLAYAPAEMVVRTCADGRLHTDVGAMQTMMQTMWDRIAGSLDELGKPGSDGLKDHAIDRYIELLERNA